MEHLNVPPTNHVKVLNGQGWVGLIDHLGTESTIVNAARVSFGKLKSNMEAGDVKLLEYLIANKHTSPLEHMVFTFSIHCPLFIRGQWHRHRTWSYNEISRRYTEIDMEFYTPSELRRQAESNRQASYSDPDFDGSAMRELIDAHNKSSMELYEKLQKIAHGQNKCVIMVCHDLYSAPDFIDRMLLLKDGSLIYSGTADSDLAKVAVAQAFGRSWAKSAHTKLI